MERKRIGSYRIEEKLGGGMGVVYKCRHEVLERYAAVKALLPGHTSNSHLRQRLHAEAKAQSRLTHSNVVTLYEAIEDAGELFIAMEYVDGENLETYLNRRPGNRLPLDEALPLFEQLLEALAYVHGESIVHRDVKPSNVMVGKSGCVKLTDFGLALLAGEPRLTATLGIAGTPQYMSPEQLQGNDVGHRSDLYSAALVLYRMLGGRHAFERKEYLAQIHDRMIGPPDLQTLVPELPPAVCEVIGMAMRVEPAERFSSAIEFRDELRRANAGFFPAPAPSPDDVPTIPMDPEPSVTVLDDKPRWWSNAVAWVVTASSIAMAAALFYLNVDWPRETSNAQTIPRRVKRPAPEPHPPEPTQPVRPEPLRPRPSPPKPSPNLNPPRPVDDNAAALAAAQRERERNLDVWREMIRAGLVRATSYLEAENFAVALSELERIERLASAQELWQERDDISRLRGRVIEARAAYDGRKQQEALWQARLDDIANAIERGAFPEAQNIAKNVKNDARTPPAVAARADELLQEAKRKLAETFQTDTRVSPTTNTIRKPSSPPRKDQ